MIHMSVSIKHKHQALFEDKFQTVSPAFAATLLLFIVSILAYLAFQFSEGTIKTRCEVARKADKNTVTPCSPTMTFIEGQYFVVQFSEVTLNRFYDVGKANAFKQSIIAEVDNIKALHIATRINFVERVKSTLLHLFPNKSLAELPIDLPITYGNIGEVQVQKIKLQTLKERLIKIMQLLEANTDSLQPVHLLKIEQYIDEIDEIYIAEQYSEKLIKNRMIELQAQKSFLWLYHDGSKWIWELVFWSLFGLFCCTLVNLTKRVRDQDYVPGEFCFLFPRLILAPVMGVVIVALLSSGYSVQDQNLNNFPYFLMLAFFIGFSSENITTKIREMSNHVLKPVGFSSAKQKQLNSAQPFVPSYGKIAESLIKGAPKTKSELENQIRVGAKAIAEAETIKRLKARRK